MTSARSRDRGTVGVNKGGIYRKLPCGRSNPQYQVFRRKRRQRWLNWYKTKKGCEECGYNENGVALDFDHRDPSQKLFNVSSRSLTMSLKRIFQEIRKCRILCANCHRVHSYNNKHFNNTGYNDYGS